MTLEHKSGLHSESKTFPKIVKGIQCSFIKIIILFSIKILIMSYYAKYL